MPEPIDSPVSTSKQQACALIRVIVLALLITGCGQPAREASRQVESDVAFTSMQSTPTTDLRTEGGIDWKIIYEAEVKLVVQDFSKTESALPGAAKEHGGYLANVTIDRTSGQQRRGRWQPDPSGPI